MNVAFGGIDFDHYSYTVTTLSTCRCAGRIVNCLLNLLRRSGGVALPAFAMNLHELTVFFFFPLRVHS